MLFHVHSGANLQTFCFIKNIFCFIFKKTFSNFVIFRFTEAGRFLRANTWAGNAKAPQITKI
jgi:hypothetical protein